MRSIKLPSWIERLAGLDPVPVPPHIFSLGPRHLSYGRFERAAGALQVNEFRSVELPDETFASGLLGGPPRDPAGLKGGVKDFVAGLSGNFHDASLVVPDAWLRVSFTESGPLPSKEDEAAEVLRFKLKRLVPFRVDELRIDAVEVTPLPGQQEPKRLLLGFAVEPLLKALEESFRAAGVTLGLITSASQALLGALPEAPERGLQAVVMVTDGGYTLLFARRGREPVLARYKGGAEAGGPAAASLVLRDLKLTRSFVESSFPGVPLSHALCLAPPAVEEEWLELLSDGLACPATALAREHLPRTGGMPELPYAEIAPMLGAACREMS